MQAGLTFEQAPPISVPLRFFLTAPLFGAGAGLLLAWAGPAALSSRWSGAMLAFTHLLTIGFMLEAMCGALLQILPVAVGGNVWRPRLVAWVTHTGLTLGAALLAVAFALEAPMLFRLAMPLLVLSLGVYVAALLHALMVPTLTGATLTALRLSTVSLALALCFGAIMASAFGWGVALPLAELTDVHAAWGLVGWSLLLLIGVAFLVVPMFQLTPAYDARIARRLPTAVFALLALWSPLRLADGVEGTRTMLVAAVAALMAVFALATLWLQHRRRRKVVDPPFHFWRLAMVSLLASALIAPLVPLAGDALRERLELAVGVLMVVGVFGSAISGMLYKVTPFLSWLHLQSVVSPVPNMKLILPARDMRRHLWLHLAALSLLLAMLALPWLSHAAGIALAAACLSLEWNLAGAARRYGRLRRGAPLAGVRHTAGG